MGEIIEVDDLVILGRAVPVERVKGTHRHTICVAGVSPTLGLIRLYPTRRTTSLNRWSTVKVPLERSKHDDRRESWKIQGGDEEWDELDDKVKVVQKTLSMKKKWDLILPHIFGCVQELIDQELSLGIVVPKLIIDNKYRPNPKFTPRLQKTLFGTVLPKTKKHFPEMPYFIYRCSKCQQKGPHDQQLIDWG